MGISKEMPTKALGKESENGAVPARCVWWSAGIGSLRLTGAAC
jgi:hypothetical protein